MATENLGEKAGLLAAAALMIDYILTAAVGISAGVTAMTSALPKFQPHTLALCLLILAILAVVNLRGVKDTGTAFIVPTFLFIGTLLTLIAVGVFKTFAAGGHPLPVDPMPHTFAANGAVSGPLDVDEGLLQRLCRHDWRGGGFQRCDGVPGATSQRTPSMRLPSSSAF